MEKIYLSLGSNIGNRESYLKSAIELISANDQISSVVCSSFYETEPQGYRDQDYFINCVLECFTSLPPRELLYFTQSIEKRLKRIKLFRWGPRTIDVDILLYGNEIVNSEDLIIPHPRMYERAFVLIPLSELEHSFTKYINTLDYQDVKKINQHIIDNK